jgi:hypothetical protein
VATDAGTTVSSWSGKVTSLRPCASASSLATRAAIAARRSLISPNSEANLVSSMRIND